MEGRALAQSRPRRGERQYLRQTFVGGPGRGSGRGCWRHAGAWAGTCFLYFQKVVSGAGHPSALRHLSAKRMRAKQRGSEWTPMLFPRMLLHPLPGRKMPEQRNKGRKELLSGFHSCNKTLLNSWVPIMDLEVGFDSEQSKIPCPHGAYFSGGLGGRLSH